MILLALFAWLGADRVQAYVFNGYKWTDGTQISMHLDLTRPPVVLQDGSASWDASATDALGIWNQYINKVRFVPAGPVAPNGYDGANSVLFASTIYGESFGTSTLAVTLNYSVKGSGVFTETDVLFNNVRKWNSYRGPQQGSGSTGTYDFHRVALHEFGHVLGLAHPDEFGQPGREALMNSISSDLDHLADDDIAGARALYAFKITSSLNPPGVRSGDPFSYQITASNGPTSYSANALPPGLELNSATGLISGRCTTSGTFLVDVVVEGASGNAAGTIRILIFPLPLTSSTNPPAIAIGNSFSYKITAPNTPTSFSATGLPAGLTLDPSTGVISGTPITTGTFNVMVTATSATAIAAGTVQIVVSPPRITSLQGGSTLEIGDAFRYQITSTHNPTSFGASGLPAEFQVDTTTGLITGTASKPGFYSVTVTAQTAYGEARGSLYINILSPHLTGSTYGSGKVGEAFRFVIKASNSPTSFSSGALPAGLQLNPTSGEITGTPFLSGSSSVQVTARGTVGDATGYISISISSNPGYSPPVATFSVYNSSTVLHDPVRPRLYVATGSGFEIIDTNTNTVIDTVSFNYGAVGLAVSPDGSTLYATAPYPQTIKRVNLETLANLPDIQTSTRMPAAIAPGADGFLYITDYNTKGFVYQIDPASGSEVSSFSIIARSNYTALTIKTTPDHKTLLVGELNRILPSVAKYALNAGAAPALVQKLDSITPGSLYNICITPDGSRVVFVVQDYSATKPQPNVLRSIDDLTVTLGSIPAPLRADEITFSADGKYAVQTYTSSSRVDTIRLASGVTEQTVFVADAAWPFSGIARPSIAADNRNARFYLVATPGGFGSTWKIYTYPLHGPPIAPKSLMNVSTRLRAQTGDNVAIGGFIIEGDAPKKVIVRGLGPTLKSYGLSGALGDPVLELHAGDGSVLTSNDSWNEHRQDVLNTEMWPNDEHEAAIVATLNPGPYTAILRGLNETSGIALVEIFDVDPTSSSRITNISTRGRVETGDNVMIGGFVVAGDQPTKVLVRAAGPSLTQYGVAGALADTTLDLFDGNGTKFASNDDWGTDQPQDITDSGHAPSDGREAALVRTLQPGAYTAIVRGKDNTTGVALVEIYNLEPPASAPALP